MSPRTQQPLTVELSLLGFLLREPMHGYEIYRALSGPEGLGAVWRLKQSRLYALLDKLEAHGYLIPATEEQTARPARHVLHITPAGRQAFRDWLKRPVENGRAFRLEFLAKLYFARQEGPAAAQALLSAQRAGCRRWLATQEAQAAEAADRPYAWLVHRFRIGQIQAMLDWLDSCEAISG